MRRLGLNDLRLANMTQKEAYIGDRRASITVLACFFMALKPEISLELPLFAWRPLVR